MKQKRKEQKKKQRADKVKIKLRKRREAIREENRTKRELKKLQLENEEKIEPLTNKKDSEAAKEA